MGLNKEQRMQKQIEHLEQLVREKADKVAELSEIVNKQKESNRTSFELHRGAMKQVHNLRQQLSEAHALTGRILHQHSKVIHSSVNITDYNPSPNEGEYGCSVVAPV